MSVFLNEWLAAAADGGRELVRGGAVIGIQSTLILGGGLALAALLRRRATWSSALLRAALTVAVVTPILSLAGNLGESPQVALAPPPPAVVVEETRVMLRSPNASRRETGATAAVAYSRQTAGTANTPTPELATAALPPAPAPISAAGWGYLALGGIWLAGSLFFFIRLLTGWRHIAALRRNAESAPEGVQRALAELSLRFRVRAPETYQSEEVGSPFLAGIFRPAIFLPKEPLPGGEEGMRGVLAHELAHLVRRDCGWHLASSVFCALVFFQPLAWLLKRRLEDASDEVCDDLVLSFGHDRRGYARRLVEIAERCRVRPVEHRAGVGIVPLRSFLARRVVRLLDEKRPLSVRLGSAAVIGVIALALAGGAGASFFGVAAGTARAAESKGSSTAKDSPTTETLTVKVRVQDEDGVPVPEARIIPTGLRTKVESASWWGWRGIEPETVVTDQNGDAVVRYPKYVHELLETGKLTFEVNHPDYVLVQNQGYAVAGDEKPVVLPKGAMVTATVTRNGTPVTESVFIQQDGSDYLKTDAWYAASNGILVTRQLPEGEHLLRAAFLPEEGNPEFSRAVRVSAKKGEKYSIELALQEGRVLRGRLDDSVPRPVSGGHMVINTVEGELPPWENRGERKPLLQWQALAEVQPDGTFEVRNLPGEQAEVTALTADFISANPPDSKDLGGRKIPQLFPFDSPEPVVVMMEPAAKLQVTVLGPDTKPVPGAKVALWPNVLHGRRGSTIFGRIYPSAKVLKLKDDEDRMRAWDEMKNPFSVDTNESGQALIASLPMWKRLEVAVVHSELELAPNKDSSNCGGVPQRQVPVDLSAGGVTSLTLVLEKKGTSQVRDSDVPGRPTINVGSTSATVCQVPEDRPSPDALEVAPASGETKEFAGQVVDVTGLPLAGVLVDAWTWHQGSETLTDAQGRFRLTDLDPDERIEVRFSKEGYTPYYVAQQPLGTMTSALVLRSDTYLEGVVTGADGSPVANAEIRADQGREQGDGVVISTVFTIGRSGADGRYRLYLKPDDGYDIQVSSGNQVARLENVAVTQGKGQELNITLSEGITFKARVVDSVTKQPVAGVRLYDWKNKRIDGTSDADGIVTIVGMQPGEQEFSVEKKGYRRWWSDQAKHSYQRKSIDDPELKWQRNFDDLTFDLASNMKSVEIVVEQGAVIRGKVLDPDGNPVAGATVAPAKTGSGNSLTGDTRFSETSEADGSFEVILPASHNARYNLVAHDGKYEEWRHWANGVGDPFQTTPGQVIEGVELRLSRPATVRGQIVDKQGNPVAGREVRASAADKLENRYYDPTVKTAGDGTFEVKFIRPGKQFIQVAPFWLDALQAPSGTSLVVDLAEGETLEGVKLVAQ